MRRSKFRAAQAGFRPKRQAQHIAAQVGQTRAAM
jgi:hypothetical protein